MLKAGLAHRFIAFISLLILGTSLSLSLLILAREKRERNESIRQHGASLARGLAQDAELGVLTRNRGLLEELAAELLEEQDVVSVVVTDGDGALLMDVRSEDPARANLVAARAVETQEVGDATVTLTPYTIGGAGRVEAYGIAVPVFTRRAEHQNEEIGLLLMADDAPARLEQIGQVRVMLSLAGMYDELAELRWALALLTSLVIAVAVLLTIALVQRMVAPLRALAAATHRIAEGKLAQVEIEASSDEIGRLARSFNRMTSQLARSRSELERYSASLEQQVRARTAELEAAQNQLVQAEKMSAVGVLVSGVAHELNNPLTGVIGLAQLLLMSSTDEKTRRDIETINREATRCKKIVRSLQTFAREHKPQKEYLGLNGILRRTLELQTYQLNVENVRVVTDLEPDLPKTMVDFHQLQRVFLNIIINAHQAMASRGGGGGGELILRTRHRNGRILVEIADSGPGIAPENLGRVFDPFFTTKEVGQGTGLGLSICYGIVHEHGGRLSARNRPGGGAVFAIELPVIEPPAGPTEEEEERPGAANRTSERKNILVVDDETTILEILYHVLRADGHRIDTAMSGATAWRKIRDEHYDLIISDLKMPGMSGQELYQKVRQLDPTLAGRIIFATGDVLSDETQGFLSESGNSVIPKPFELDVVRKVVNEALVEERA